MPFGHELYLGLVGKQVVLDTAKSLGLTCDERGDLSEDKSLDDRLKQAHRDALEEIGLKIIDLKDARRGGYPAEDSGYLLVCGLDGKIRETDDWGLEVHYDPDECGHKEEDMLIGVSLISRYFPVYLDWYKEYGGSGETVILTPDVLKNIEIARKHLGKVLPFIKDAPIVFREMFY